MPKLKRETEKKKILFYTFFELLNQDKSENKLNNYIRSTILILVLTKFKFPPLVKLKKEETASSVKKIQQLTKYLQGIFVVVGARDKNIYDIIKLVKEEYLATYSASSISQLGIGNGILLILAQNKVRNLLNSKFRDNLVPGLIILLVELSMRRITVQYARRQQGNKIFQGRSSYIPIRLNVAGVTPQIFMNSVSLVFKKKNKLLYTLLIPFFNS